MFRQGVHDLSLHPDTKWCLTFYFRKYPDTVRGQWGWQSIKRGLYGCAVTVELLVHMGLPFYRFLLYYFLTRKPPDMHLNCKFDDN